MNLEKLSPLFAHQLGILVAENWAFLIAIFWALLITDYKEILKQKDVKHYQQLRYLADKHNRSVLKIRFVLMPFSFVFLLDGEKHYHIIWETLDTEEATFMWHVEKNKQVLKERLGLIDKDLGLIRNKGRQAFTETTQENFSRIIHDYEDPLKGFILWRDQLEERMG